MPLTVWRSQRRCPDNPHGRALYRVCPTSKGGRVLGVATRIASLGYAVPGAVLAVGILIPFAAFDNALDAPS